MSLTPPSSFSPVLRGSASNTGLTTTQIDGNFSGIATNANWSVSSIASLISSAGAALIGIIQTGAGAVARNVAAKLGETVSITDYGAVPSTSGAAAAFLAAMNSLGSTGGKIIIPPGTWLWESQITSTKDYVHVDVQEGAVVTQTGTFATMLYISNNYWAISGNGVFDGANLSPSNGANIACWGNYCSFRNFETRKSGGQGLGLWGASSSNWLTGCSVNKVNSHNNGAVGLLMSEARYCRITSNILISNGLEGITVDNQSGYNTIDGNIGLSNCTSGGTGNIGAGLLANHNVFTNNILQGAQNGCHGLFLQGQNNVVENNVFTANTGYGLYLDGSCVANLVGSNEYDANTLGARYLGVGSLNNIIGSESLSSGGVMDLGGNFYTSQPIDNKFGLCYLRAVRLKLQRIALGLASYTNTSSITTTSQLVIACIGDSYTQWAAIWTSPLLGKLWGSYGNAGMGWFGFGFQTPYNSAPWTTGNQPIYSGGGSTCDLGASWGLTGGISLFQIIGSWVCSYNNASGNAPSLSTIASSTANDYVRLGFPANQTAAILYYSGNGTGVIAVSWNDGSTYGGNISLSTVGAGHITLSGIPGTANTLRIKVVSGTVTLAGIDLQSSANGVRLHKIAGGGSYTQQWANVTQAAWAANLQALNPDVVTLLFGGNEQINGYSPMQYGVYLQTIIANIRSVLPECDILLISPAENQRNTNAYPMTAFAQVMRKIATDNGYSFIDMQGYFGLPNNNASAYAFTNAYCPWYYSDGIHPDPNTGGVIMTDAIYRALVTM